MINGNQLNILCEEWANWLGRREFVPNGLNKGGLNKLMAGSVAVHSDFQSNVLSWDIDAEEVFCALDTAIHNLSGIHRDVMMSRYIGIGTIEQKAKDIRISRRSFFRYLEEAKAMIVRDDKLLNLLKNC